MFRSAILVSILLALGACGDPLAGVDRISDVELSDEDPAAQALPGEAEVAREGFFGSSAASGGDAAVIPAEQARAPQEPAARGGFLGLFRRAGGAAQPAQDPERTQDGQEAGVEVAALSPEDAPQSERQRGGLFGLGGGANRESPREGPDARDVAYGTVLPYGVVARVCEAKGKPMGQKIESAPARGYALYDSASGSAVARTFYITGFADGCPRQLTAANVLLGAASLYEQLHYGPGGENLPVGATDKAYETVKRDVCGARKGKPCGSKIDRMDRSTFFVSAYDSFGNSSRWTELLVHDGAVIAAAIKTSG